MLNGVNRTLFLASTYDLRKKNVSRYTEKFLRYDWQARLCASSAALSGNDGSKFEMLGTLFWLALRRRDESRWSPLRLRIYMGACSVGAYVYDNHQRHQWARARPQPNANERLYVFIRAITHQSQIQLFSYYAARSQSRNWSYIVHC